MVSQQVALAVTVATLAAFTGLGIWYARGRVGSVEDYISARNTAKGGMTAATLIASGMGAWILFSPAEAGAAFGGLSAILGYAVGSALPMIAFIWLGPRIRQLIPEGHTLTEYVHARYGAAMHAYVLFISASYMFVFLAAEMTGIAGALSLVAGIPAWQTATLVGLFVLAYTGYGGLMASLFTDTVQTLILLPLMGIGLAGALIALGGPGEIHANVLASSPSSLDPSFWPGLQFGIFVVIAVLGAEMLNQAWWQRIYAAQDEHVLRRGFAVAAVAIVPMILLAGLFGLAADGLGLVGGAGEASISFFLVLQEAFPAWVVLAIVLLAILLVMSTADTLFNAISSLVTADLPYLIDAPSDRTLQGGARLATVIAALGAIFIGSQGYSVLTLFLLADLLAAATFLPMLMGLYFRRLGQGGALVGAGAGLVTGLVFFPTTRTWLEVLPGLSALLPEASFLWAFVGAAGVSGGLCLLLTGLTRERFDLSELARRIGRLGEAKVPATPPTEDPQPGGDR